DANGQIQPFNGGARFNYETDDRGVYRIYGLPAGNYLVSAGGADRPGVSRRICYPLTYFSDAIHQTQAQLGEIQTRAPRESIDSRMGAPIKAYAVSGRVVDADSGQPVFGAPITVGRARGQRGQGGQGGQAAQTGPIGPGSGGSGMSNAEGEYRVTGLTPGP